MQEIHVEWFRVLPPSAKHGKHYGHEEFPAATPSMVTPCTSAATEASSIAQVLALSDQDTVDVVNFAEFLCHDKYAANSLIPQHYHKHSRCPEMCAKKTTTQHTTLSTLHAH